MFPKTSPENQNVFCINYINCYIKQMCSSYRYKIRVHMYFLFKYTDWMIAQCNYFFMCSIQKCFIIIYTIIKVAFLIISVQRGIILL